MRLFHRSGGAPPEQELRLVVGLGNPGRQYERTRHNVGFMVVEELARSQGGSFKGSRQRADLARIELNGTPVLLAMPVTFMNDSGHAVRRLTQYYQIPLDRLLVVHDEIDLPFGTLRLRPSGSSAGNRGVQSIIAELGSQDFARLRVGVGRPRSSAVGHVLGGFSADERAKLPAFVRLSADAVETALAQGVTPAMNQFNRDWLPEL